MFKSDYPPKNQNEEVLKMVNKDYVEVAANAEEAKKNLLDSVRNDGISNLESVVVTYEVVVTGKRGKPVSGKAHPEYALAFASALAAAKLNPDKYDPAKNPVMEVTAKASYDLPEPAGYRKPSGSAPNQYGGRTLTDLF